MSVNGFSLEELSKYQRAGERILRGLDQSLPVRLVESGILTDGDYALIRFLANNEGFDDQRDQRYIVKTAQIGYAAERVRTAYAASLQRKDSFRLDD